MSISPTLDAATVPDLRPAAPEAEPRRLDHALELELLYRSHFGKVAGYFRRFGLDDAAAHDLAQDTFVNALRGLPAFQGAAKLSTWMWTIARNVLMSHLRSRPADRSDAAANDEPVDPDTLSDGVDVRLTDMCDCIRRGFKAFARDHPERAHVLFLAAVEGWTREQLAEFLGRTPQAATEYLSQCRAKLRPYIADCDEQD